MPQNKIQKIHLKNILIGLTIGLSVMFLILLILYYIFVFLPNQEVEKRQKAMEENERIFWEYKKAYDLQVLQ